MIPLLQMFDIPEAMQIDHGERSSVTTVPTQSLAFMNSPLVRTISRAQQFAHCIRGIRA